VAARSARFTAVDLHTGSGHRRIGDAGSTGA
jgi:hypothetical protein